jgi:chitinase
VALSWTASSDNVAVAGYRVFRDGVEVASTSGTSLIDTAPGKSATHTYYVVAFDGAGNLSPPSIAVSIAP